MPIIYAVREEADHRWSVVVEETGTAVRLAGVPLTGLEIEDAKAFAERLMAMAQSPAEQTRH